MRLLLSVLLISMYSTAYAGQSEYDALLQQYETLKNLRISLESTQKIAGPKGEIGDQGMAGLKGATGEPGDPMTEAQFVELNDMLVSGETWLTAQEQRTVAYIQMIEELDEQIDQWYSWADEIKEAIENE